MAIAGGDALQIEGVASLTGHPLDAHNAEYIRALRERRPKQFERSVRPGRVLQREGSTVIEVNPRRILFNVWKLDWDLETGFEPHALILNVPQQTAHEIYGAETDQSDMYRNPAYRE